MATFCTDAIERRADVSWPVQVLIGLAVTAALVIVGFFFVDQPVMLFVRDCPLDRNQRLFLKWLTRPPEAFVILSPFVLLAGLLRRRLSPWGPTEKAAVAAAVSTLLTALAALVLKITFGRSTDGFHPFHLGAAFWMFPSGHTACTLSVIVVAQTAFPRWRLCCWSLAGVVAVTLMVLSYHFVGDILGGTFLGWAIAGTVVRLFGLKPSSIASSRRAVAPGPVRAAVPARRPPPGMSPLRPTMPSPARWSPPGPSSARRDRTE
jgi:membrane-associated phospholipid phosphatase